jgi:hypothetical protein
MKVRTKCRDGTYIKENKCLPLTNCGPAEIELSPPSFNSDRTCQACPSSGPAAEACKQGIVRWWNFASSSGTTAAGTDTKETIKESLKDQITGITGSFQHSAALDHITVVPKWALGPHCGGMGCVSLGDTTALDLTSQGYYNTGTLLPSGPKTLSFFVSATSFETPQIWLGNEGNNMFYVGANHGMLEVGAGQTEVSGVLRLYSTQPRASGGTTSGGFFHHFCLVDNGEGEMTVYQDGHLLGVFTYEGETETQPGDAFHFVIGGASSHWKGGSKAMAVLDEVKLFNKALSAAAIQAEWGGVNAHPVEANEWKMVFRHSVANGGGFWPTDVPWKEQLIVDKGDGMRATLDSLESYRSHDGFLTFKLVWPTLCTLDTGKAAQSTCDESGRNFITWRQSSNPAKATGPTSGTTGFEELDLGIFTGRQHKVSFQGLERSTPNHCLLDGSTNHDNWFFTVGAVVQWPPTVGIPAFPGPWRDTDAGDGDYFYVDTVELYAYDYYDEVDAGDSSACSSHRYSKMGDACCRSEDGDTSPKKTSNGVTDAKACSLLCDEEGSACMGFEYRSPTTTCELHLGPVHHVQENPAIPCTCYVKTDTVVNPQRVYQDSVTGRCVDVTVCHPDQEFEVKAPSPTTDRVCKPCIQTCPAGRALVGSCQGEDAPTCNVCPIGTMCAGGTTPITPCPAGQFQNSPSQPKCLPCTAGGCSGIGAGMVGDTDPAATCPEGYYCPAGTTAKFICAANSFCPAGASAMQACEEGTFSKVGQAACSVNGGGGGDGTTRTTTPPSVTQHCAPGSSKTVDGGCQMCSAGRFSSTRDAAECAACTSSCTPGKYLVGACTHLTNPVCDACPAGSYCDGASGFATQCPVGTHRDEKGAVRPADCEKDATGDGGGSGVAGYYNVDGAAQPCPPGSFCPAGATVSFPCPSGNFAATIGLADCTQWRSCTAGQIMVQGGSTTARYLLLVVSLFGRGYWISCVLA